MHAVYRKSWVGGGATKAEKHVILLSICFWVLCKWLVDWVGSHIAVSTDVWIHINKEQRWGGVRSEMSNVP